MATFKHISSKNADYGAAEQYLTFEHDEFTMAFVILLSACGISAPPKSSSTSPEQTSSQPTNIASAYSTLTTLEPYSNLRYLDFVNGSRQRYELNEYNSEEIYTYTFNQDTILEGNAALQSQILEEGKNPGLGIIELHNQGITGKNVNVAIIDQPMLTDHPEFAGKITSYYDTGCETDTNSGSMHGPAVTSILAGTTTGVAPDVKVWFAAVPSWKADSKYYADALNWIVSENQKLPEDEKIRLVSVSAAPSGEGSPFTENLQMWDDAVKAAQEMNILVLDCRTNENTGFIFPCFFDPTDRENVSLCSGGFPTAPNPLPDYLHYICAPCAYRTMAEEYTADKPSYQYWGQGGLSWSIPYCAGVLALGWQVRPDLSPEEIIRILFETAASGKDSSRIIDPPSFIKAVRNFTPST